MKFKVEKTELYTRIESDDGSVAGQVIWWDDKWELVYIDNRSGEVVKVPTDEEDHWKLVGMLVVHLLKIGYGVVVPD